MSVPLPERVRDLLALAIDDEVRARDRYAAWKGRTDDPGLQATLAHLEREEERHRVMLEALREMHAGLPIIRDVNPAPLPLWADRPAPASPRDVRELLAFAVRDEHEAYLRYYVMAEAAPSGKMREACRTLSDEEASHQRALEAQYQRLFPNG